MGKQLRAEQMREFDEAGEGAYDSNALILVCDGHSARFRPLLNRRASQDDAEDIPRAVDGVHPVQRYLGFMHGLLDTCSQGVGKFVEIYDALYPSPPRRAGSSRRRRCWPA